MGEPAPAGTPAPVANHGALTLQPSVGAPIRPVCCRSAKRPIQMVSSLSLSLPFSVKDTGTVSVTFVSLLDQPDLLQSYRVFLTCNESSFDRFGVKSELQIEGEEVDCRLKVTD